MPVEYTPQSYLGSDLDKFFGDYSKNQVFQSWFIYCKDPASFSLGKKSAVPNLYGLRLLSFFDPSAFMVERIQTLTPL